MGQASTFAPYVAMLPTEFPGVPHFWGEGAMAVLRQYPTAYAQAAKRCRFLLDFASGPLAGHAAAVSQPLLGAGASPAEDAASMGWALAAVSSRAFNVGGRRALLPLVDMLNHGGALGANCAVEPEGGSGGGVRLVATRDTAEGEELLLDYGALSTDFLLLDYGFVAAEGAADRVSVAFDLGTLDAARSLGAPNAACGDPTAPDLAPRPFQAEKLQLLGLRTGDEVFIGGEGLVDGRLLAALRVMFAQAPKELRGRDVASLQELGRPLSGENEASVMRTLLALSALLLNRFPTTYEEDIGRLAGGCLGEDERLALHFVAGKKRGLTAGIEGLRERLAAAVGGGAGQPAGKGPKAKAKAKAKRKGFGA